MESEKGNKKENLQYVTPTNGLGKFEPGKKNVVLFSFGSFNPIHNGHLGYNQLFLLTFEECCLMLSNT